MRHQVTAAGAGMRLDKYLVDSMGKMGLRGWRRAINSGLIRIQGGAASPGMRLSGKEELEIGDFGEKESVLKPRLVGRAGNYLFFYKPAGLHSAALAGGFNYSLESWLGSLCEAASHEAPPVLLQRLDQGTEGIVAAAVNKEAADLYRQAERDGRCRKSYLAILDGILDSPVRVNYRLEVNGGKKVRVSGTEMGESWTEYEPLWTGTLKDTAVTIARCCLCSGRRHQIRAHAAALGLPLLGDTLYGGHASEGFALTHYRLAFPGCEFQYIAPESAFGKFGFILEAEGIARCT